MAVTHRLHELRTDGKHQQADTLAVEALRNQRPTVTLEGDHVRIETKNFVGEHALDGSFDPSDAATVRKALARRGTYALGEDTDGRTFETGCLYDAVVEQLLDVRGDSPDEVASDAPEPGVDEGAVSTDEQPGDGVSPAGPVEADRSPTSVIRQAVAAVQSQLRN